MKKLFAAIVLAACAAADLQRSQAESMAESDADRADAHGWKAPRPPRPHATQPPG